MNEREYDPAGGPPGFESESELLSRAMSILGKRTSDRKRKTSRENAKRPRKRSKRLAHSKQTVSPPQNGLDTTVKIIENNSRQANG